MELIFDLKRPDPLYFAWKNAVNDPSNLNGWPLTDLKKTDKETIFKRIEEKYGCETLEVRRKDDRYLTGVTVKFRSEKDLSWFLLKWG